MTEQRRTVGAAVTSTPQQIIVRDRIQMFVNRAMPAEERN
jgi:hypothetical protein